MNIILGGRNGVLILPHDPANEAGITALLTTPSRHAHAEGYIDHVRNIPPELHEECHQKALKLWTELQDARCEERCEGHLASGGALPLPKEPSPHANTAIWKKWLRNIHEHPHTEGQFTFKGVPFVCNGYLNVHVDAARALLTLLLLSSKKSRLGTIRGLLRDAFLQSAAMLLNMHGMYGETIMHLHLTVTPQRHAHFYSPSEFTDESHLNCEHVARFLASIGMTTAKAETWQQWAAAYVDMLLTEHPEDALLQEALRDAHARIDTDHSLVLTKVNPGTLGYYSPVLEQSRTQHAARRTTYHSREDSSLSAEAGPSAPMGKEAPASPVHPEDARAGDANAAYANEQEDEDTRMGPV